MARANARTEALGAAGAIVAVAPAGRSALQRAGVSLRLLGDRSGLDFDGGALSAAADAAAEREAAAAAHAEPAAPGAAPLTLEEAVQAALAVSTAAAQPFGPKPAGVDDPVELRAGVGGSGHDHGPDGAPPPAPAVKPDPGAAPNAPPAPAAVKPDPGAVASGSAAPLPPHAPRAAVPPAPAFSGATLVICPLVAVLQWKAEIERFTAPGTLVVALYHGAKRTTSAAELADADVVLSSFGTLESDYRRSGATTSNLV